MRLVVVGIIAGGSAFALSACAQLVGIDVTSGADHSDVTLGFVRTSVGAAVATAPEDLTAGSATYLVDDTTDPTGFQHVAATLADGDPSTWTAKIADGEPQSLFTLPDETTLNLFDLGRDVLASKVAFEHPNPTVSSAADMVDNAITIPAWNGTDTFQLSIIGTWARHALPAPALAGDTSIAATFPYSEMTPIVGKPPLAAVTDADAVLALAYAGGTLVGAYDQTGIGTGMVAGTIAAVTADTSITTPIDQTVIGTRLGALVPAGAAPTIAWSVTAAPGAKAAVTTGVGLASGSVAAADTMIASTFGNPFATTRMWPAVFSVTANSSRTYMMTTSGPTPVAVSLASSITEMMTATTIDAALDAPLVGTVTLGGTALATDGLAVAIVPAMPVVLAFTMETGVGTPALYTAAIDELVPSVDGLTVDRVPVLVAVSKTAGFRLPADKLVAGHTYVARISCTVGGYPTVAVGDLQERGLPMTTASVTPGVFTVMTP